MQKTFEIGNQFINPENILKTCNEFIDMYTPIDDIILHMDDLAILNHSGLRSIQTQRRAVIRGFFLKNHIDISTNTQKERMIATRYDNTTEVYNYGFLQEKSPGLIT